MNLDYNIFQIINNLAEHWAWMDALAVFCASYLQYGLGLALVIFLFLGKDRLERIKNYWLVGLAFLSAIVSRLVFCEIIKLLVDRSRPFETHQVIQLIAYEAGRSFPSGHAAFFFALAMAVYLFNKRLGWWFFAGAALIGLSRIYAGIHYPSDILGGALVGLGSGWLVVKIFEKWQSGILEK